MEQALNSVIGSILLVFAAVFAFYFAIIVVFQDLAKSTQHKSISYSILVDGLLPNEPEAQRALSPQEEPVTDARLVVIQIQNTGNIVVRPKDYDAPLTFEFGKRVINSRIGISIPNSRTRKKAI